MTSQPHNSIDQNWLTSHQNELTEIGFEQLTQDQTAGIQKQLMNELSPGHLIHGAQVKVLGAFTGSDDILLELECDFEGAKYALVHLTWGGQQAPPWPSTHLFPDLDEWLSWKTPSPEEKALWDDFNDQRRQRQKRRQQLSFLGFYLVIGLGLITLFLAIMTQIKPEWFGL